jgi:hypothetical protein
MALTNYTDLVAAINGWLNRSDMTAIAPDLIALAEAEFNRRLRTIEMEGRATATLAGEAIALPADFMGLRSISVDNTFFEQISAQELFDIPTSARLPRFVAVTDGQFFFRPAPASGTVKIDYYQKIPALTVANPTNWLMTKHPDLYLFAALAQAEFYNWNDGRLPVVKARTEELIEQINDETHRARYGNRRLKMSMPVYPSVGVRA